MNYRHLYHAGNFADVFKHWVLTLVLEKLCQKDTPFCLLDTHAGLGLYDLQHANAQTTLEHEAGVAKIIDRALTQNFDSYATIIKRYQAQEIYPGSAAIMQYFLRENDRLFLNELHPQDYLELRENFIADKRIKISNNDAYQCLKALLPPKERRGLVFIDPAFEQKDEFAQIINGLREAIKRFANGIYVIWYPIKDRKIVDKFYRNLQELPLESCISIELHANENMDTQLTSNGLVIINPPWQLDSTLLAGLPELLKYLDFAHGTYNLRTLVAKN